MAVPHIFATQPTGTVPASYLDEDFAYLLTSNPNVRQKLLGTLTLYVRTDGSDSNNGMADNSAGAFLTWQAAVTAALAYDFNSNNVIIKAGEQGTSKTWSLGASPIVVGTITGIGALYFKPSTSGTTITSTGAPAFFLVGTIQPIFLGGIIITSGGSGHGLVEVGQQSILQLDPAGGPNFGADDFAHIYVHDGQAQAALLNSSYTISGAAPFHIFVTSAGNVSLEGCTVTISAPVAITTFVNATKNAYIQSTLCTFVNPGNVTGAKYLADDGGVINTLGNGANYFPGTDAGQQLSLGVYVDTWTTTPLFLQGGGLFSEGDVTLSKATPAVILDKPASGTMASMLGKTNGVARWQEALGTTDAESGGNAGSNYALFAFADGGGFIGTAISIVRSTLATLFGGDLSATGKIGSAKYYTSTGPTAVTGATYSILDTDNTLVCNRAGTVTLTLPAPANYAGRVIRVLTVQNQTVVSNSSDVSPITGGGGGTAILAGTAGKWADLTGGGSTWQITASN